MDAQQNGNRILPLRDEEFQKKDFSYNRFGIELNQNDSTQKWEESLNALSEKILRQEKVSSKRETEELESMFWDYINLSKMPKSKKTACKQITPRDLIDTKNAVILSHVYYLIKLTAAEHFTKSTNNVINTATLGLLGTSTILGVTAAVSKLSFLVPVKFLVASSLGLAAGLYYNLYIDIKNGKDQKKCAFQIANLREAILGRLNGDIAERNREIRKLIKERTCKLRNAKTEEEKQDLLRQYNAALSDQQKERLASEAMIRNTNRDMREIFRNLPNPQSYGYLNILKEGYLEKAKEDYQKQLNEWKENNGSKERKKQIEQEYKNRTEELAVKYSVKDAMLGYAVRKFHMQNPDIDFVYPLVPENVRENIRHNVNVINNRRQINLQQLINQNHIRKTIPHTKTAKLAHSCSRS